MPTVENLENRKAAAPTAPPSQKQPFSPFWYIFFQAFKNAYILFFLMIGMILYTQGIVFYLTVFGNHFPMPLSILRISIYIFF